MKNIRGMNLGTRAVDAILKFSLLWPYMFNTKKGLKKGHNFAHNSFIIWSRNPHTDFF